MAYNFEDIILDLEYWGLSEVLLPFLLIFTLIFAVLSKSKLLGEEKKNINLIISLIIALMVVIPHVTGDYPLGFDAVEIINMALPSVSVILVAIVAVFILIGVWGVETEWSGAMSGIITIVAFLVVAYIFGSSAGWWEGGLFNWLDDDTTSILIIIIIFGLIIGFVTRDPGTKTAHTKNALESIGKVFKKT